jgi:hypothetical protein
VVALNPFSAPSVRTHDGGPSGAVAVAWPAGQHPVIATISGAWFCDDDLCADVTDVNGGPPAIEGFGTAATPRGRRRRPEPAGRLPARPARPAVGRRRRATGRVVPDRSLGPAVQL